MNIVSHFSNIGEKIISNIEAADSTIWAAVAWFTDKRIFDALLAKLDEKVNVKIILRNDAINFNNLRSLDWATFISKGGKVFFLEKDTHLLHHKFVIIDGKILINGSYNWTYYAEKRNRENILVFEDKEQKLIEEFYSEFEYLERKSKEIKEVKYFDFSDITDEELIGYIEKDEISKEEIEEHEEINKEVSDLMYEGKIEHNNTNYEEAILIFSEVLKVEPENTDAIHKLAWSYIRLGEKRKDNKYFQKGVELVEGKAELFEDKGYYLNVMGCLYHDLKKLDLAKKFICDAIEHEEQISYYCNLRNVAYDLKNSNLIYDTEVKINQLCANYVKEHGHDEKEGGDWNLMSAYYQRAFFSKGIDKIKYLRKSFKEYKNLGLINRDLHDYNEILQEVKNSFPQDEEEFLI